MTRLILTTDASAAGALQRAGLADLVIAIERRLVWGPLPSSAQLDAFFAPRTTQAHGFHWQDDTPSWRLEESDAKDLGLVELCATFDAVELWIDPTPNAQLILIWLLDYWRAGAPSARIAMCHADGAIGAADPQQLADLGPRTAEVTRDQLELASRAWQSYRAPTPEACFALLNEDFNQLPRLRACMRDLLEELPASTTGLGATETRMLELIAPGDVPPFDVFPGHEKLNERRVFDYWEVGALLDGLARCAVPAVTGLNQGPFCLAMLNDAARHEHYKRSRLSLTGLGKAVLAGEEDFSRRNPIERWWGGTCLTNEQLWRWDAENRVLVAPG